MGGAESEEFPGVHQDGLPVKQVLFVKRRTILMIMMKIGDY